MGHICEVHTNVPSLTQYHIYNICERLNMFDVVIYISVCIIPGGLHVPAYILSGVERR